MRELQDGASVWAITCYFNPAGYKTRRANYTVFRQHLSLPLVTVELSFGEGFELGPTDADRLVQINVGDIMWQKERLLNLALEHLPDHCSNVVWLDCELVFERKDLGAAIEAELERYPLIQPFSSVIDLKANVGVNESLEGNFEKERSSMGWLIKQNKIDYRESKTDMKDHYSPGHAWGVRRDLIEEVGFYEGMILGSSDFAMAKAAFGKTEDVERVFLMNEHQTHHYSEWAGRWYDLVDGSIGVVEGEIRHLWHGNLDDRGYTTRYVGLSEHDFNPYQDIRINDQGSLSWNSDKPKLHQFCRDYFRSRKEDGI